MTPRQLLRYPRLVRLLAAMAVMLGVLVASALPASAASARSCRRGSDHVVCFSVTQSGSRTYVVHIGIDVTMSREDAQARIDAGGIYVVHSLVVGADLVEDDSLFYMTTSWAEAGDGGLAAELELRVDQAKVNEDDDPWDRYDELYALVGVYGHPIIYTNTIGGYF